MVPANLLVDLLFLVYLLAIINLLVELLFYSGSAGRFDSSGKFVGGTDEASQRSA